MVREAGNDSELKGCMLTSVKEEYNGFREKKMPCGFPWAGFQAEGAPRTAQEKEKR